MRVTFTTGTGPFPMNIEHRKIPEGGFACTCLHFASARLPSLSICVMTTLNVVRTLAKTGSPYRRAIVASTRSASSAVRPSSQQSIIPLSNVEAQWEKLSSDEQLTVHQQLEALQKKDWKELSIDEKKAGEPVSLSSAPTSCTLY